MTSRAGILNTEYMSRSDLKPLIEFARFCHVDGWKFLIYVHDNILSANSESAIDRSYRSTARIIIFDKLTCARTVIAQTFSRVPKHTAIIVTGNKGHN